jgi:hypothetical protein
MSEEEKREIFEKLKDSAIKKLDTLSDSDISKEDLDIIIKSLLPEEK